MNIESLKKLLSSKNKDDRRLGLELLIKKIGRTNYEKSLHLNLLKMRLEEKHIIIATPAANTKWDNEIFNVVRELYAWNTVEVNMYIDWDKFTPRQLKISVNLE